MKSPAPKTPKLFIGGQFVRSESGRTYKVGDSNVPLASRIDARDAVSAAAKAQPGWAKATAYNRGQILYRLAEMLQRRDLSGLDHAERELASEIILHFAGWTDKYSALISSVNPVAGEIHNFTQPEPTGIVVCVGPKTLQFANLVLAISAPICSGCAVIAVLNEKAPLPGLEFAEALATSDLPPGVVNILSGVESEIMPHLSAHFEVDALDLTGSESPDKWTESASETIKRVHLWPPLESIDDWQKTDSLRRIEAFVDQKTTWHATAW